MKTAALVTVCLILLAAGCATTDDPGKGGLFSYSPDAYEKRRVAREARLAELHREQEAEKNQRSKLQAGAAGKREKHAALSGQLRALDGECSALRRQLSGYQARNAAQEAALRDLRQKQAALQDKVRTTDGSSMTDEQKAAEAEKLRR
ncbi:MAG: hypothetical protein LBP38_04475, partial [Desulfovibrio sp.]|nr:hypothetical protein [Desulfovibrio sp.]